MQAIILKKNIFSEGNEIITMYTRELGKVRSVAKSIKSPKSKLSFGLQSLFFTDVDLLISRKLGTIKGVKALDTFTNIYGDEHKIRLALYATEIILKSTADEQPNEGLFDLFLSLLKHLDSSKYSEHLCADFFALRALALNGYALEYQKCVSCGKEIQIGEEGIGFSPRKGGFICSGCGEKISDAQRVSSQLYQALRENQDSDFEDVDNLKLERGELHRLTEAFAIYILERNLNTSNYLGTL